MPCVTGLVIRWSRIVQSSLADKAFFAGRQFLNPFCGQDLPGQYDQLETTFQDARQQIMS